MRDKYLVMQDDLKDCGVCALLSIIKYYDGYVSKEYLRELTKTTRNGVSAINLLKTARELGFEAYGVKASLNEIKNNYLPIIAHVTIDKKYNHFVVIYEIDVLKNQLLIMDPGKGFIKMSFQEFTNITTNYYLVLKVKNVIPKYTQDNNFINNIKVNLLKYKWVIITIIFMSFIYTILNIIASYNFKLLFEETNNSLLIIFLVLSFLIVFRFVVNLLRNTLINSLNFIIDESIINKSFDHIINLPYLYYKNHTIGDLLVRINDLGNIKELISNFFVSIFVDFMLAIIVLIVMFKINLSLTIIILSSLLLFSFISFINMKIIKIDIRENHEMSGVVNNFLVESLSSFETIKNLSLQKYIKRNFYKYYKEFNEKQEILLKKVNIVDFFKNNVISIGNLMVLYYGINYINNNELSITLLITFISLCNYLIEPIKSLLNLGLNYQNTKESIRRIKEIYNIPKEDLRDKNNIKSLNSKIDIINVSYSYNGIDKVINNINLEFEENSKILIYGNSGCGKSSLIKLLIKYLDSNYEGTILIGGYDLKVLDLKTIRDNICYVSQNEFLYTNSIYENITLGRKIKYSCFLDICKNLSIDEIVSKSNLNYNLLIEDNGENLSGGEKARILIARSLLCNSKIYIFDETFSSVDTILERKILKYLMEKLKDKMVIVISHRKSNLDLFEKVVPFGVENEKNRDTF